MIVALMPRETLLLLRRRIYCILTKNCCLNIMMKNLTRSILPCTGRERLSRYIINSLLIVGVMVLVVLRIMLWPVRMLHKGLGLSGRWMYRHLDYAKHMERSQEISRLRSK